jgi:glycosyltransferase involved in cell wall biosynthesis
MKILFLVPYPVNESPSQRFRFEQYFDLLLKQGYTFKVQSFLDDPASWRSFFSPGKPFGKLLTLSRGFLKRFLILLKLSQYDFVFIHREVTPIGPPIFEWLIAKIFRKRIIYDFDDAIWLTDRQKESFIFKILKWRTKVNSICRWSYKISCGNEFLASYARKFNCNVFVNPTTIDTERLHNRSLYEDQKTGNGFVIGWTGSHSTLKYLEAIEPALKQAEQAFPELRVLVIADQKPDLQLHSVDFRNWSIKTEISDLIGCDVGIMPLPPDEWSRGKCGFKALQYMALGIPTIASPVGENVNIIDVGRTGLFASTSAEWTNAIATLRADKTLRLAMGSAARQKVIQYYSVLSNSGNFLSFFAV